MFCKEHSFELCYCCFNCQGTELQCALCIRDFHAECSDSYIFEFTKLRSFCIEQTSFVISQHFQTFSESFLKEASSQLKTCFVDFKEKISKSVSFIELVDEDFNSRSVLKTIKNNYSISPKDGTSKLSLTPKYKANQEDSKRDVRKFKSELEKNANMFLEKIEKIQLDVLSEDLKLEHFCFGKGLKVARVSENETRTDVSQTPQLEKSKSLQQNSIKAAGKLEKNVFGILKHQKSLKLNCALSTSSVVKAENKNIQKIAESEKSNFNISISLSDDEDKKQFCFYSKPLTLDFIRIRIVGSLETKEEEAEIGIVYSKTNNKPVFDENFSQFPKGFTVMSFGAWKNTSLIGESILRDNTKKNQFYNGNEFYFKFSEKKGLSIFNKDRSLNLKSNVQSLQNCFFFVGLTNTKIKVELR